MRIIKKNRRDLLFQQIVEASIDRVLESQEERKYETRLRRDLGENVFLFVLFIAFDKTCMPSLLTVRFLI